jgi:thioredoxin-related protein
MLRDLCALALGGLLFCATVPAASAEVGDDGLHVVPWIETTFLDLREDLADANAAGQRLLVMVEQRGCIYCTHMHEEVYPTEVIEALLTDAFYVVRINMHGSAEVIDFDGEAMEERDLARRWRNMFTPTLMFFPEEVEAGLTGAEATVAMMPGAFGVGTLHDLMNWVLAHGYDGEEDFQRYHARMISERAATGQSLSGD